MQYEVGKAASTYSASLFSGEGFVTRFTDEALPQPDVCIINHLSSSATCLVSASEGHHSRAWLCLMGSRASACGVE